MTRRNTSSRTPDYTELVSVSEAAKRYGLNYYTVSRWIREGRLKALRVGPKLIKIDVADLDALMHPIGGDA